MLLKVDIGLFPSGLILDGQYDNNGVLLDKSGERSASVGGCKSFSSKEAMPKHSVGQLSQHLSYLWTCTKSHVSVFGYYVLIPRTTNFTFWCTIFYCSCHFIYLICYTCLPPLSRSWMFSSIEPHNRTTLTQLLINVHMAWHVAENNSITKSWNIVRLEIVQMKGLSEDRQKIIFAKKCPESIWAFVCK